MESVFGIVSVPTKVDVDLVGYNEALLDVAPRRKSVLGTRPLGRVDTNLAGIAVVTLKKLPSAMTRGRWTSCVL